MTRTGQEGVRTVSTVKILLGNVDIWTAAFKWHFHVMCSFHPSSIIHGNMSYGFLLLRHHLSRVAIKRRTDRLLSQTQKDNHRLGFLKYVFLSSNQVNGIDYYTSVEISRILKDNPQSITVNGRGKLERLPIVVVNGMECDGIASFASLLKFDLARGESSLKGDI